MTAESAMSESIPARGAKKTTSESASRGKARRSSTATADNGTRRPRLARATGGQGAELQAPGRYPLARCKGGIEAGRIGLGNGRVVAHGANLARGRQKRREVAAPCGRVLGLAVPLGDAPCQHAFDPPAHARGRRRHVGPDRLENAQHVGHVNLINPARPDEGIGVLGERARPLLGVLERLEPGRHAGDVGLRRLLERRGEGAPFHGHRVFPGRHPARIVDCSVPRRRERDEGIAAEPDFHPAPADAQALPPAPHKLARWRAARVLARRWCDDEEKPVARAVMVAPDRGGSDESVGQFAACQIPTPPITPPETAAYPGFLGAPRDDLEQKNPCLQGIFGASLDVPEMYDGGGDGSGAQPSLPSKPLL